MSSKQPTPLEERLGKIAVPYGLDLTVHSGKDNSMEDHNEVCEFCKYWERWSGDRSVTDKEDIERGGCGWCQRYAPSYRRDLYGDSEHQWPPNTYGNEWCGEFKYRPNTGLPGMPNIPDEEGYVK